MVHILFLFFSIMKIVKSRFYHKYHRFSIGGYIKLKEGDEPHLDKNIKLIV